MHQLPGQSASAAHDSFLGSRVLLAASRKNCTEISYGNNEVVHSPTNQGSLYFVEAGLAIATAQLANSRRQVVALYVPGDIINYEKIFFERSFSEVSAVSSLQLARITTGDFINVLNSDRRYERCFYRFVAYQAIIAQAWIANVGRRNAIERTAHLLCELFCRLQATSTVSDDSCIVPLTQHVLADILGLSLVHLNRSLKHIRETGLASFSGKRLHIFDWRGLIELADFDRSYLDVAREPM